MGFSFFFLGWLFSFWLEASPCFLGFFALEAFLGSLGEEVAS